MIYLFGLILVIFAGVILFGAPYLPTLKRQSEDALDLLNLKPGQTLIELGSGDGRVMLEAAKKGLNVVGYELNPLLVVISYFVTFKYRKNVKIIWGNYWQKDWPKADGVFVFLITRYMSKLNTKVNQYTHKPIRLVSFAFRIPDKKYVKKNNSLFLYIYK